jgi:hypothetical protein
MRLFGCMLLGLGAPLMAETVSGLVNGITHEPIGGAGV